MNTSITSETRPFRWLWIGLTWLIILAFFILPLFAIFIEAFRKGWQLYLDSLRDPHALAAVRMTLLATFATLPFNTLFGLAAAWCLTRFEFRGKNILISLLDLPLAVSPVVAGMLWVLVFGSRGWFGEWLEAHNFQVIYETPGILLATAFVTFPYVARSLLPFMASTGKDEEMAAVTLGARPWTIFFKVTLPNIKWALLYGALLCQARAMGEFGAVSVVSAHVRGGTNTLPLHIELLYNEYQFSAAFACSTLLALVALVTILLKAYLERRTQIARTH